MKSITLKYLIILPILFLIPRIHFSTSIQWEAVSDDDLKGYLLFIGTESGHYSDTVDVGNRIEYELTNLEDGKTYYFAIKAYDNWGNLSDFSPEIVYSTGKDTDVPDRDSESQPSEFTLEQNYPNPFNPETTIKYSVEKCGYLTLTIHNIRGELVTTLVAKYVTTPGPQPPVRWNGKNYRGNPVASGIYICRLQQGRSIKTQRMTLAR